jgi:hypothetical protein
MGKDYVCIIRSGEFALFKSYIYDEIEDTQINNYYK